MAEKVAVNADKQKVLSAVLPLPPPETSRTGFLSPKEYFLRARERSP